MREYPCAIVAWLECFQEKPSWRRNEQVCQGRKRVKRFERSNGLDAALYKNISLPVLPFNPCHMYACHCDRWILWVSVSFI